MTINVIRQLNSKNEQENHIAFGNALRLNGHTTAEAGYGSVIAWLSIFTGLDTSETTPDFVDAVERIKDKKVVRKTSSLLLSILEKKAKHLSNEEIILLQAINYGESIGIPIIKTLEKHR